MEIKKFEYEDRTKYYIVFGSETFWVKESKEYPTIGEWTICRRDQVSNNLIAIFRQIGKEKKFNGLDSIIKFLQNREYE